MSQVALNTTRPKASKGHPCGWCVEEIAPGETYIRETFAEDGKVYSWCLHEECMAAEANAWAYNEPMEGEPACHNTDISGGGHERGKNCFDCSDMPIQRAAAAEED